MLKINRAKSYLESSSAHGRSTYGHGEFLIQHRSRDCDHDPHFHGRMWDDEQRQRDDQARPVQSRGHEGHKTTAVLGLHNLAGTDVITSRTED